MLYPCYHVCTSGLVGWLLERLGKWKENDRERLEKWQRKWRGKSTIQDPLYHIYIINWCFKRLSIIFSNIFYQILMNICKTFYQIWILLMNASNSFSDPFCKIFYYSSIIFSIINFVIYFLPLMNAL